MLVVVVLYLFAQLSRQFKEIKEVNSRAHLVVEGNAVPRGLSAVSVEGFQGILCTKVRQDASSAN